MNLLINLQDGTPGYQTRILKSHDKFTLQALHDGDLLSESTHDTLGDAAREMVACWVAEYEGETYTEVMRNLKSA